MCPDANGISPVKGCIGGGQQASSKSSSSLGEPSHSHKQLSPYHQSACESHRDWIEKQLDLDRNGMSIYQDLVEQFGFTHKYSSVKRFVRSLKQTTPKRYDRLDFPPGKEAQVDYGEGAPTLSPQTGKHKKPRLFVMTLKHSRRSFRKVVWKSSQEVWALLHEEAFHYFGGSTLYVVLDNLKEGVIKADIYDPEINPVYAAVLNHYGAIADPSRVCEPNRKGTVENAIQHTQNTALKGRQFDSIEEQNKWLIHWEETWAAPRAHGRAKRRVCDMFAEEKSLLHTLPQAKFQIFNQGLRTVGDDGFIHVENSYYCSQPAEVGIQVIVRIYESKVEIIDPSTMKVIRRHEKSIVPGQVSQLAKDRVYNPTRQTQKILDDASHIGPSTSSFCQLLLKKDERTGNKQIRGVVSLTKKHSSIVIEKAATKAVERGVESLRVFKRLVKEMEPLVNKKPDSLNLTQDHDLIRPPSDYAKFWRLHANKETQYD